jgi:uncharacterized protein (TIGR02145 family)
MKKYLIVISLILGVAAGHSQSLSVFDVDTTNFPTMKAKFLAYDKDNKQIGNFSISDFKLLEDAVNKNIISVNCPSYKEPVALSSVLTIDVSSSMSGTGLTNAKSAATAWINGLPLGKTECAITSFSNESNLVHDFTADRNILLQSIASLTSNGGTDYDMAYWETVISGLEVAKRGKYKRVLVFISDGQPNQEPKTQKIIDIANKYNVVVYCVTLNMPSPQCLKDISTKTGGLWYENITTEEEARNIYLKILNVTQDVISCTIEWESGISCKSGIRDVEVRLLTNGAVSKTVYQTPYSSIARLEFNPVSVKFKNAIKDTCIPITVTARNGSFNISNITGSNSSYRFNPPTSFTLKAGESRNLTVCYTPADSGYTYCKFSIENDSCPTKYYASGGFTGQKATTRTLKLIKPNGGEEFVVGADTVITWEGVLPEEKIKIEYSTNNGASWITIIDTARNSNYNWLVPKTPSNQCLARVTAKTAFIQSGCENWDVQICNQIWMGCNLDVETYQNGDTIPHVTDLSQWLNQTTGAWCYYNNDPALGAIYGKLYNWYAVNDPRGLAPIGWHIPSDEEWKELEMCLGMSRSEADRNITRGINEGGKLKATGTIEDGDGLWHSPNTEATNESGFSALPGGFLSQGGPFYYIGTFGCWWTSTEYPIIGGWCRMLENKRANIYRGDYEKGHGFSVRCVRDN